MKVRPRIPAMQLQAMFLPFFFLTTGKCLTLAWNFPWAVLLGSGLVETDWWCECFMVVAPYIFPFAWFPGYCSLFGLKVKDIFIWKIIKMIFSFCCPTHHHIRTSLPTQLARSPLSQLTHSPFLLVYSLAFPLSHLTHSPFWSIHSLFLLVNSFALPSF